MSVRMTHTTVKVLLTMLRDPQGWFYGLELMDATGIASGTLYPILARLYDANLLEAEQEDVDPSVVGRPRRTHYRLTGAGVSAAKAQAAELSRLSGGKLGWAGI